MSIALSIENLSLDLGEFSLKEVNFCVEQGDYFILLGKSGAGKSLILEMIAGLINPDEGRILLRGKDISHQRIQKRDVGIVFQDYAVFPHLTVMENICYPLKRKNIPRHKRIQKAHALAQQTGIQHLLNRKPGSLSGGELQRVALTRSLALEPACLLLDEPLSALDVETRYDLRALLRNLNKQGQTIIHITHDFEEAFALGTHVGIIHQGSIIQTGTLTEVFQTPRSRFVANLTGMKNFFSARITQKDKALVEGKIELCIPPQEAGIHGFIYFRAEDVVLSLTKIPSSLTNQIEGKIISFTPTPKGTEVMVGAGIKIVSVITTTSTEFLHLKAGNPIWVSFKASAINFIKHF